MKTVRWSIPLVLFVVLIAFLWVGLGRDPREVPSPLIGKPAPSFALPQIHGDKPLSTAELRGKVWLLNVWASWCVSCRVEHPLLLQLAKAGIVPVYGLDYKDKPDDARAWLAQNGDPYTSSIVDQDGRVGIDYGVYGVPETFVIDRSGIVRYKQIGPLSVESLQEKILPLVRELQK
jgi:cytochrome c biogenesis protein CcmG/thiol:disulfide interchange protein DsbE